MSVATHFASDMPGAGHTFPDVFNSFSAFFHGETCSSDDIVVILHLSGGNDRCFTAASGALAAV